MSSQSVQKGAFTTLISVFFFWGFVAASNDILIPVFKENLHLTQWQSQLVSFAFYVAYTVGSVIYFGLGALTGGDLLNKIGYKNGVALGLVISALGTLLFIPAAQTESFGLFISGLFTVGLGFSLQQTAANPLAINMGDPKTGSQRLSLAGGINNVGTTIGPLLVSLAIFGSVSSNNSIADIGSIQIPYLILGAAFLLVAFLFKISSIPDTLTTADTAVSDDTPSRKSALQYPQLVLGMIAIFVYVGVEVSTVSNLPEFLKQNNGMATDEIAPWVSLYWASLMIGRWTSAVGAFGAEKSTKALLRWLVPYLAFGVFAGVNYILGHSISRFAPYLAVILVIIAADLLSKGSPSRQLLYFSLTAITALLIGMFSSGMISVFAFISVGLFCSTLWPCIFTLAIAGLGKHTNKGSSFLIMMIMGGGIISLLQGWISSDDLLGIQQSYWIGVLCFAYLAFYAVRAKAILKDQGVKIEG
ncbi:MAG TPA: MFS transporter [Luteibaculaceae bacterium]|nr:MFS transporter [Luteibaculaceae bacterium]